MTPLIDATVIIVACILSMAVGFLGCCFGLAYMTSDGDWLLVDLKNGNILGRDERYVLDLDPYYAYKEAKNIEDLEKHGKDNKYDDNK